MHTIIKVEQKYKAVKIYLFDTKEAHDNLLPLSFTRPVAAFRCGIMTIREKWEKYLPGDYGYYPVEYLRDVYGTVRNSRQDCIFIIGNLLPDEALAKEIEELPKGSALFFNDEMIAFHGSLTKMEKRDWKRIDTDLDIKIINYLFDIFLKNFNEIRKDFRVVTKGRKSQAIPKHTRVLANAKSGYRVFIEEGAEVDCNTINIKNGPVYIGKGSKIMEGSCLRGPLAVCDEAEVRMGAKVYGGTTIGPHSKVGGEINNTVIFGYSNKAHDGYMGNAVIGEWCNIGAGANASNLKNDYSLIRIWNYATQKFMKTDLQFCGVMMGDHSKIGINAMVNTATVIGVGVNLHGGGFPRNYLSNFSEGSPTSGFTKQPFEKFMETAERVKIRRGKGIDEKEKAIYKEIYENLT